MITDNQIYEEVLNKLNSLDGFFIKSGVPSAGFIRKNFENGTFDFLKLSTQFLNPDSSIAERYYCIKNNIKSITKCLCGNKMKFISTVQGYRKSCKECFRKTKLDWKTCSKSSRFNMQKEVDDFHYYLENPESNISSAEEALNHIKIILSRMDLQNNPNSKKWIKREDYRNNKHILKYIINRTSYITYEKRDYNWSNRFYDIINNINNVLMCPLCNKNKLTYKNSIKGYAEVCDDIKCVCELGAKNRIKTHIESITPNINAQGFDVIIDENYKGLNHEKTKLHCHKCNKDVYIDISDGKWKNIRCYECYGHSNKSHEENAVCEYITSLNINFIRNTKKILKPYKELDIYCEQEKIALEYNGSSWHSYGTTFPNNAKDESYYRNKHYTKFKECNDLGIHLLQINSYEWNNKNKNLIWKSIISNKFGKSNKIYARKCEVKLIENKTKNDFLNSNHLQGMDNSSIKLGLYHNNVLVSVMTFGKPRFNKKYQWELVRFCNILNTSVIGGASKLLNHFIKHYKPKNIISYADMRYSNGSLYKNLGFDFEHISPPSYCYVKGDTVTSRFTAQKHNLPKLLKDFDPNKTEVENMFHNKYRRLWDCGTMLFIWKK